MPNRKLERSLASIARACRSRSSACDASQRLRALVSETSALLARLLRRAGVRDGDAADVAQRVYLIFYRRLHAVRPGCEQSFLCAIARREASHQRRSYRRRRELADDAIDAAAACEPYPDAQLEHEQRKRAAIIVLEAIDESSREVLLSFALEERSLRDIADTLALPLGTVKSRLRRARKAFATEARRRFGESANLSEESGLLRS